MKKLYKLLILITSFIVLIHGNIFATPLTADQKVNSIKNLSSIYPDHIQLIESIAKTYTENLSNLEEDVRKCSRKDFIYTAPESLISPEKKIIYRIKYIYLGQALMSNLPPDKVNVNDMCHLHILAIFYNMSLPQIQQAVVLVKNT